MKLLDAIQLVEFLVMHELPIDAIQLVEFLVMHELPMYEMLEVLRELETQNMDDRKEWFDHCASNYRKTSKDYFVIDCINKFFPIV